MCVRVCVMLPSNCSSGVADSRGASVLGLAMLQAASMAVEDPCSSSIPGQPLSCRFQPSLTPTPRAPVTGSSPAPDATITSSTCVSSTRVVGRNIVPTLKSMDHLPSINVNPAPIVTSLPSADTQCATATDTAHHHYRHHGSDQHLQQEGDHTLKQQASGSASSLNALLNPAPAPGVAASLPTGFVLSKDGKIKKKRGRKPTPGLSDEDRRQARLLKNRRTAEISRRRKLAQLQHLSDERDRAHALISALRAANQLLTSRLAAALDIAPHNMLQRDAQLAAALARVHSQNWEPAHAHNNGGEHERECDGVAADTDMPTEGVPVSDVSQPCSIADSDEDHPSPSSPPTPCASPRRRFVSPIPTKPSPCT